MKNVSIELLNIQSHQHTAFNLQPGLNFILADDNNVGKSTIFKILSFAVKMPDISNEDAKEILRVGEDKGYASFKFDNSHVILWLFRDTGDRIRVFFESRTEDGASTRTTSCPSKLLEALSIIRGDDGTPINFNDADSVQLVVQDTPKNDEVLARVLIDLKVEAIRKNAQQLSKQIVQDYRYISSKLEDTKHTLSSLHYNEGVNSFRDEEELLYAAVRVADLLDAECGHLKDATVEIPPITEELKQLTCAQRLLSVFDEISFEHLSQTVVQIDTNMVNTVYRTLLTFSEFDVKVLQRADAISAPVLDNMSTCTDTLAALMTASYAANNVVKTCRLLESISKEIQDIQETLSRECKVVNCPVKGDVYYSDEECVPLSDRPTS